MTHETETLRANRFLHIREVVNATSLSRATIYRLIAKGKFPCSIQVSTNRVAWPEGAVRGWMNEQANGPPI